MPTVILHDQRLDGAVEPGLGKVLKCDATTSITQAFNDVKAAVNSSPTEFVIACHGYMTHDYDNASNIDLRGGQGLQLCRETLQVGNIRAVESLKDIFSRIWLMACGPAGTLVHTSRPFCREFAFYTNCSVIASDTAQSYNPGLHDDALQVSRRVLRFGKWEGNVFEFTPDGNVKSFSPASSPLP